MTTFFETEPAPELNIPQQGLRTALSIAGLDPSGGAGLIADIRTFTVLRTWGLAVAATLTYQNTMGVSGRYDVPSEVVIRQLEELFADRVPNAIKTGALGNADVVREVGLFLDKEFSGPLVADPVMMAGSGGALLDEGAVQGFVDRILPRAAIVTPNVEEAALLSGFTLVDVKDVEAAALRLVAMGARSALVTGVRLESEGSVLAADVYCDGDEIAVYACPWEEGLRVHGTGCVLSAAIAACLAKGMALKPSVEQGREVTRAAIVGALATGRGARCAEPLAFELQPERSEITDTEL